MEEPGEGHGVPLVILGGGSEQSLLVSGRGRVLAQLPRTHQPVRRTPGCMTTSRHRRSWARSTATCRSSLRAGASRAGSQAEEGKRSPGHAATDQEASGAGLPSTRLHDHQLLKEELAAKEVTEEAAGGPGSHMVVGHATSYKRIAAGSHHLPK